MTPDALVGTLLAADIPLLLLEGVRLLHYNALRHSTPMQLRQRPLYSPTVSAQMLAEYIREYY